MLRLRQSPLALGRHVGAQVLRLTWTLPQLRQSLFVRGSHLVERRERKLQCQQQLARSGAMWVVASGMHAPRCARVYLFLAPHDLKQPVVMSRGHNVAAKMWM